MKRMKNIVVGIDFSSRSRDALHEAVRLAAPDEAKLRLVHVVEAEAARQLAAHERRDVEDLRAELTADAKLSLKEWCDEVAAAGLASFRVVYGHATAELSKQIKQVQADLFVGGVRGTVNDAPGAGAQATRLVRSSPCEVLLVKEGHTGPFERVVAGIDFSPTSRRVVEQALAVGAREGAKVAFVHVYSAPWLKLHYRSESRYPAEFRQRHLTDLKRQLREFVGDTGGVKATYHLHQCQTHGCGIADFARHQGADLLVLGTRGHSSLKYLLLGSTAEYLLREQPCSVLAVHPTK